MQSKIRIVALAVISIIAAQAHGTQFDDRTVINQRIGGGRPIDEPATYNTNTKAGGSWNVDLTCSDMSLKSELIGGFDSGSFKQLQASLMGNLKAALNPLSLVGSAIQRANPDLYETMMNGSMMLNDEFGKNLANCQSMQQQVLNGMPEGSIKQLSIGQEYSSAIKRQTQQNVQLKDLLLKGSDPRSGYDTGAKGITFDGSKQGTLSKPIKVVEHTTYAGFNALAGRSSTDNTSLSASQAKELGFSSAFKSPAEAAAFTSEVVGETKLYSDDSVAPRDDEKGIGAKRQYAQELENVKSNINELLAKDISTVSASDLQKVSTSSVVVNNDVLLALKQIHPADRLGYINALSTDIALARTHEKLLYSVRIIDAGLTDASVSNVEAVRSDALFKRERLMQEMDLLEREIRFKRELSEGSAQDIMRRANMENRSGSYKNPGAELPVNKAN